MTARRNRVPIVIVVALLVAAPLAAWSLGAFDASHPPARPEAPGQDLLARAIAALGGRERLAAVRTMEIHARGHEHGRSMSTRLVLRFPDAYRQDVDTGGVRLVHALSGEKAWASLDGTPVPLAPEEVRRLESQLTFTRLALLVSLRDEDGFAVTDAGEAEGLRWLEVEPKDGAGGPYRLGFDPASGLIVRAEWETAIPGRRRPETVTAEFADYREVDGVMVAFEATYRFGGQVFGVTRIERARIDGELAPDTFEEPVPSGAPPAIVRRRTEPGLALVVEPLLRARPADVERTLAETATELGLERNGPVFRHLDDPAAAPGGVGLPVERPERPPEIEAAPGRPRLVEVPGREVLTLVVPGDDPDDVEAAAKRLLAEARDRGLRPGRPFRLVLWDEDLRQLQLPITPR